MFAEAGLPYSALLEKVPSSRKALAVSELARERGAFASLHGRLFDAYWARGEDIGDEEVLRREGAAAGLDGDEVVEAARSEARLEPVERSTRRAQEIGVSGVPAWLVDDRLLVPGAQPHELFGRVMERLGHEPVSGADG